MGYTNSSLVCYTRISPNKSVNRNHAIDTITIHCMAGNLSIESCGNLFASPSRQASSNYGIGSDGRIAMYVEEKDRAWSSSNSANDHRAVTIEVANDEIGGKWHVSDKALAKLIDLCVDICKRNGIKKLNFTGDKTGNLTMHKWFANTDCPGPYLESKFPYIADEVNKRLIDQKEVCNVNIKVLKKGAKGNAVKALQTLLIGYGFSCGACGADSSFGPATDKAVRAYQKAKGLDVDGSVGPATWGSLLGV